MKTVIVELASAVPETDGVLLEVREPFAGPTTTGAAGGVVSTVKVLVLELTETLPTESVAMARTVCEASLNVEVVKVQLPEPLAVVVPTETPSMNTVTVALASAVPVMEGVVVATREPLAGLETTGAAGAVVSTVKVLVAELIDTLPTASVAAATTVWLPSLSDTSAAKDQAPAPLVIAVPMRKPSTITLTVLFASAVPVKTGWLLPVREPSAGAATMGSAGSVVSTVKVLVFEFTDTLPTASVAVARAV